MHKKIIFDWHWIQHILFAMFKIEDTITQFFFKILLPDVSPTLWTMASLFRSSLNKSWKRKLVIFQLYQKNECSDGTDNAFGRSGVLEYLPEALVWEWRLTERNILHTAYEFFGYFSEAKSSLVFKNHDICWIMTFVETFPQHFNMSMQN